ncbi:mannose-1-phosphate guanylyltransferase/mannose-6-phosphate isomerase [Pseudooceanicola sp. LIPI14-2-Ac024]|uniref:mannose-1-phosphate guanylyltransferase/mannose-6-phosphate isomerase n=1 Tax=Pseudooceanicola sp. LIPI14-2-Ac024 TaxID=3344875 RepID=UPI0035CFCEBC
MTHELTPVILCGGSGTRLWPVSRKSYPKQFVDLVGDESLFRQAARRCSGPMFDRPVIVTNSDFRFIATQQLAEAGVDPGAVLIEPEARNTAPALLAAALLVARDDPERVILAAPSDHLILDQAAFRDTLARALPVARGGRVVTLGIVPTRPETGYGYLELDGDAAADCVPLARFVEKPPLDEAERMLASGRYLWNAGMFVYTAATLIALFEAHMPEMLALVRRAVDEGQPDLGFLRLAPGPWAACEDISIDHGIMEKADNLSVAPHRGDWSDLGGWEAIHQLGPQDASGTVATGPVTALDCAGSLLRADPDGPHLVGLGLRDVVAVTTPDAVLIADRSRAADLGSVVKTLRKAGLRQADTFRRDHRPWGFFETLILGDRFQVKRIVVDPGAKLSLQSHVHRAEHWVVVSGTAQVTVGDTVRLLPENQSVYVPLGAVHRLENPGKVPVELIEVQTGSYLGEDDITRYDDVYARSDDSGTA